MQNDATVQYHVPNTDLALQVLVATTSETDLNLRMRLSASIAQPILMKVMRRTKYIWSNNACMRNYI
jgi:hypothetical protein